ncbi:MAG: ADP-ribosylglycohydrolase [Lachnospiraceae bacterium]|nr:ADP-ribosylglycohydrolase [Lachnospiraceae bacterium]
MKKENRKPENINIWKDGIIGVLIGDALGCPVQFRSRKEIAARPVTTMIGHGTYDMPVGTWTDDGSMTMATFASILDNNGINAADVMDRFVLWLTKGEYTPFGEAFDNGRGTTEAIFRYLKDRDIETCGGREVYDNGNGSLMRIMPVCLYCYEQQKAGRMTDEEAISAIHQISGLTHNHMRAKAACGLYYFMVRAILRGKQAGDIADGKSLTELLQKGIDEGFAFYKQERQSEIALSHYGRLRDLHDFRNQPSSAIRSSGYVVDTIEAAVWCLTGTDSFRDALLTAVNLGDDTDTVGAVCGGLAGLFYGYENIPEEWLAVLRKRDWIESLCAKELG